MRHIAIFASGTGTNAEEIIRHFKQSGKARVMAIFTNNPRAKVVDRAIGYGIPVVVFTRDEMHAGKLQGKLKEFRIDLIVLAGFLWLLPSALVNEYKKRIVNIHPALLPKFGGTGMYGGRVHEAVLKSGESETGITIHYVNEEYDRGEIIEQHSVAVSPGDGTQVIARKVQALEHKYYPAVIERIVGQLT